MPIPWLLLGAAGAFMLGASAHDDAKKTIEKAQGLIHDAERLYDRSKTALEIAQNDTEAALFELGCNKKRVLSTSVNQFITAYKRLKSIKVSFQNETKKFTVDEQDVLEMQKLSDIYSSVISSGATGAATGALIALAASGTALPVLASTASIASSILLSGGGITSAIGIMGTGLSYAASMTPLAAIAAPVVLFTGINSSIKADENLEKAQTTYRQAESAAEKMKAAKVLCEGISMQAKMFDELLLRLDTMFSMCVSSLDDMTTKKCKEFNCQTITEDMLSQDELKLIAITRSLAGAIKSVIEEPLLSENGTVSYKAQDVYDNIQKSLPEFIDSVKVAQRKQLSDTNSHKIKTTVSVPKRNFANEMSFVLPRHNKATSTEIALPSESESNINKLDSDLTITKSAIQESNSDTSPQISTKQDISATKSNNENEAASNKSQPQRTKITAVKRTPKK